GACSAPVTFEVRNGGAIQPVTDPTLVTLSDNADGSFALFNGAGCATDGGQLTLAPDASTGTFSYAGGTPGAYALTLAAPGLAGASQAATISFPGAASLAFVGTMQTVR